MTECAPWECPWAVDLLARIQIFLETHMSMFSSGLRKGHAQGPDCKTILVKLPQEFGIEDVYSTEARGGDKTTMRPFFRVMVEERGKNLNLKPARLNKEGVPYGVLTPEPLVSKQKS
jgi:hypothetical protein